MAFGVDPIKVVVLGVVAVVPLVAWGGSMSDEEQLHETHDEFAAAWSRGDAEATSQFWTEDGVRVGAGGDVQHGRKEIAAALARLFEGRFKGAKVKIDRGSVRRLTAELCLYQGTMQIEPPGDAPPIKGYYLEVMKKVAGHWLMLESHPKLFPPQPPQQR